MQPAKTDHVIFGNVKLFILLGKLGASVWFCVLISALIIKNEALRWDLF